MPPRGGRGLSPHFKQRLRGEARFGSVVSWKVKKWKESFFNDIKKGYNREVKNSKLGKALRESSGMAIGDV